MPLLRLFDVMLDGAMIGIAIFAAVLLLKFLCAVVQALFLPARNATFADMQAEMDREVEDMMACMDGFGFGTIDPSAIRGHRYRSPNARPARPATYQPSPDSCWSVLGIEPTKELDVIKAAHRVLAKKYHPDIPGNRTPENMARFRKAQEAYQRASAYAQA